MKTILTALILSAIATAAFAATQPSPELLKQKENFSKTELFEPHQVFADKAANAALLREYEANPAAYKPDQLMPIALCYLSFGDIAKAKSAFESFLNTSPKNLRALRTLGTISLLSKDIEKAMQYYKTAIDAGDEKSVVFLCSAYIMANKIDEIKKHLPTLKKLAKDNLEALNVTLFYAGRDKKTFDEKLAKEILSNVDARKMLETATPDGMSTILRIYMMTKNAWPTPIRVIPARSAALAEIWPLALSTYKEVLKEDPKNAIALRGMGLVSYRTGDVLGAADYVMKAYDAGDKDAIFDGIDLFLLSRDRSIWEKFSPYAKNLKMSPQMRAALVQYAVGRDDSADVFYFGALGENNDLLFKDEAVVKLLEDGVKKYSSDSRAAEVSKKLKASKK